MSNLLGGNSSNNQSSSTSNQGFGQVSSDLGSTAAGTGGLSSLLSQLLTGTGGTQGYNQYQQSTGFQNQLQQGSQAITDNAASRGLLQSGATAKALQGYGTGLADQNYNNYLSQILGAGNQGIQAAGTIASAGQTSNSSGKSSSKTGLGL